MPRAVPADDLFRLMTRIDAQAGDSGLFDLVEQAGADSSTWPTALHIPMSATHAAALADPRLASITQAMAGFGGSAGIGSINRAADPVARYDFFA